jgi:hypothetical protein
MNRATRARRSGEGEGQPLLVLLGRPGPDGALAAEVPSGPAGDLAAVGRRALDDGRHLVVVVAEHVVEQEHGPLHRVQPLEHEEEGHRKGVGQLGRGRRVVVGDERLGQPRTDVLLAAALGRAQAVDGEAGGHRGQEGPG